MYKCFPTDNIFSFFEKICSVGKDLIELYVDLSSTFMYRTSIYTVIGAQFKLSCLITLQGYFDSYPVGPLLVSCM